MQRCLELDLIASHSYGLARRVTEINEIGGRGMMSLPPLPNDERKLPPAWLSAIRAALRTRASSVQQQWRRVADAVGRRGSLRVAVIGVSSSAGCGSGEAWELASLNSSRRVIVRGCSLDRSWIRRLADELVALRCRLAQNHTSELSCLEGLRVTKTPEVAVSHKNAVGVGYFTTCTHTHLPSAGADVILLEVATNVWGGDPSALVRAVRMVAPDAAVAFVKWIRRNQALPREVSEAATAEEADIVPVNEAVAQLHLSGLLNHSYTYAQRGLDDVHPSAVGHALIGAITARFVISRLLQLGCGTDVGARRSSRRHALSDPPKALPSHWSQCWNRADQIPRQHAELPRAPRALPLVRERPVGPLPVLPVPLSGNHPPSLPVPAQPPNVGTSPNATAELSDWSLVDEGQAKGVLKLGLASSHVDAVLRVGPISGPSGAVCSPLSVRLGYLVSASRPNMGALRIDCDGCQCLPSMHYFQELWPFPELQADALYTMDPTYLRQNLTVTATTEFIMLWDAITSCTIRLTNVLASARSVKQRRRRDVSARPLPKLHDPSHVRVDSLQLSLLTRTEMISQINRLRTSSLGSLTRHGRQNPHGRGLDLEATKWVFGLASLHEAAAVLRNVSRAPYLHLESAHHPNFTYSRCTFDPCTSHAVRACASDYVP